MPVPDASRSRNLWSFEFLALCLIIAVAFCNVSVFYSFYHYLGEIGIPVEWRGFLVGLEPMSAFVLRLFVLPWLHVRNAFSVAMLSLVLLIVASCTYLWVTTVPAMIVLRIFHGAVFVLLTSAVIGLVVNFIPGDKSGQGFGAIAISTMIPYAVIPSLFEWLLPYVRHEADIYAAVSVFSVAALLIMAAIRRRIRDTLHGMDEALQRRPTWPEIRENLRLRPVFILIAAIFLVYLAHATFFYFTKDLTLQIRAGDVGLFFTISMATMIAVRVLGTAWFDRIDKMSVLWKVMAVMIACPILLTLAAVPVSYYLLAALYGLCMGVVLPLLNAVLFLESPPPLRGLNANITLFTMDMAYFLVPYIGGIIIALGAGFDALFYIATGYIMIAVVLVVALSHHHKKPCSRS